jgi:hypothetical protein
MKNVLVYPRPASNWHDEVARRQSSQHTSRRQKTLNTGTFTGRLRRRRRPGSRRRIGAAVDGENPGAGPEALPAAFGPTSAGVPVIAQHAIMHNRVHIIAASVFQCAGRFSMGQEKVRGVLMLSINVGSTDAAIAAVPVSHFRLAIRLH